MKGWQIIRKEGPVRSPRGWGGSGHSARKSENLVEVNLIEQAKFDVAWLGEGGQDRYWSHRSGEPREDGEWLLRGNLDHLG